MARLSNRRHRFPPAIIQHSVWLYVRFTLSYRDVEDLLATTGLRRVTVQLKPDSYALVGRRHA